MKTIIGIDVCSQNLQVCLLKNETFEKVETKFRNSPVGIRKFVAWTEKFAPCKVVLEATGGYEKALVNKLDSKEIQCNVVNPARIRSFARGIGKLHKTDKVDAFVIARFGQQVKLDAPLKLTKKQKELKELVVRRMTLVEMKSAEKHRGRHTIGIAKKSVNDMVKFIDRQLKKIEIKMMEIADDNETMSDKIDIMTQQKGVGKLTAVSLLALLPEMGLLNKKQIAALVGVAPMTRESGKWKGKSFISGGRKFARKALYMAALVASKHDKRLSKFYNQLLERGKPKKVALVAIMRKLLITLNYSLKIA